MPRFWYSCVYVHAHASSDLRLVSTSFVQVPAGDGGKGVTAYKEVTLAAEIARELIAAGFLPESEAHNVQGSPLDDGVLEAAKFEVFASFRTNRSKYRCVWLFCLLFGLRCRKCGVPDGRKKCVPRSSALAKNIAKTRA